MKIRHLVLAVSFAAASACLSGCGDPPQPVDAPASTSKGTLPPGHVPIDGQGKAPAGAETRVAGTILFEGAGFDQPTGTLFVNIRLKGMKAPWLSRKYELANSAVAKSPSGAKSLPFELRSNDPTQATFNLNGQHVVPPGQEFEVYACYKSGPNVEDKTLADAAAPFQAGKTDYELTVKLP